MRWIVICHNRTRSWLLTSTWTIQGAIRKIRRARLRSQGPEATYEIRKPWDYPGDRWYL